MLSIADIYAADHVVLFINNLKLAVSLAISVLGHVILCTAKPFNLI